MALTKYREGSIGELWSIAFPLMISSFSILLMLFVDRLLLAHYSTEALNAAVNAATLGWAFIFSWFVLTNISEVFVAQHNGAERYSQFGAPVWQMIWVALTSVFFFIPMAYWGSSAIYGDDPLREMERQYFFWMMVFGPTCPLYSALSGFFIGQGKTRIITILAVAANLVNVLLDLILIFGWKDWIPSLGITGAAIATSGSLVFQIIILGAIFLNKSNRFSFGTGNYHFNWTLIKQCLKIGFPGAAFIALEILGWAAYYEMMRFRGENFILIAGICQSLILLIFFFAEGISKAATAISGNLIGAKRQHFIHQVFLNGLRLHFLFFVFLIVMFMLGIDIYIDHFIGHFSLAKKAAIESSLQTGLLCIVFYTLFEGIRALIAGILTAAGDTLFLLVGGTLSVWLLLILPIYTIIILGQGSMEMASLLCVLYSISSALLYLWRFRQGKWKTCSI